MSGVVVKHFGRVKDGVLYYYKPSLLTLVMNNLEGKEFVITLEERFIDTTQDQHGYYRTTNRWLIENTEQFGGWTEDNVHEFAVSLFLTHKKVIEYRGISQDVTIVESTADIGKRRMRDFIDKWIGWLLSEEIEVPTPEEMVVGKYRSEKKN